jgi:hypothetical protein
MMEMSESLSNSGVRNHLLIQALAGLASIVAPFNYLLLFSTPNVTVRYLA